MVSPIPEAFRRDPVFFGPTRCILGTNWPTDRLFSSYDTLINAYSVLTSDFPDAEWRAMISENAQTPYHI